jgi:hypothetical protein
MPERAGEKLLLVVERQGSTKNRRAKERAAVRRAIAAKAAAGAHAAAARGPPNPSGRRVWAERQGPHGWQRVWRGPEENGFHGPPEHGRAAEKACHDAMPQWLRGRMYMQGLARGLAPPAEPTRLRLLELHQRLRLRALQPVRRLRQWLRLPKRGAGHVLARAGRCLAEPRARGGGAAGGQHRRESYRKGERGSISAPDQIGGCGT